MNREIQTFQSISENTATIIGQNCRIKMVKKDTDQVVWVLKKSKQVQWEQLPAHQIVVENTGSRRLQEHKKLWKLLSSDLEMHSSNQPTWLRLGQISDSKLSIPCQPKPERNQLKVKHTVTPFLVSQKLVEDFFLLRKGTNTYSSGRLNLLSKC